MMAKPPYEFLEHTGDLKIRSHGETLEAAFLNMVKGMEASRNPSYVREKPVMREIAIKAQDRTALLVDFLSEVNYLNDAEKEAYEEGTVVIEDNKLSAQLRGYKVREFEDDIKAVTYHGLEIKKRDDGAWELTALFDI